MFVDHLPDDLEGTTTSTRSRRDLLGGGGVGDGLCPDVEAFGEDVAGGIGVQERSEPSSVEDDEDTECPHLRLRASR